MERIPFAVDVEVAEGDQVVVPAVYVPGPLGEPLRYGLELGDALLGPLPEEHVQRGQNKGLRARAEADRVGGARELPLEGVGPGPLELLLGASTAAPP